jgi:hypothetical protein
MFVSSLMSDDNRLGPQSCPLPSAGEQIIRSFVTEYPGQTLTYLAHARTDLEFGTFSNVTSTAMRGLGDKTEEPTDLVGHWALWCLGSAGSVSR